MKINNLLMGALVLIGVGSSLFAEVKPAGIFTDNMVLQANVPIRVWGTADKGEKVSVEFMGTNASAVADDNGYWRVDLPAQKYVKEGVDLVVQGINKIIFRDVLVGEVWLGSGQSNMEFQMRHVKELDNVAKDPKIPANIRYFLIKAHGSPVPEDMHNLPESAGWKKYHRDNYEITRDVSVLLTLFAQKMYAELDVPIGVISVAYGGANLETWMNEKAIAEAGMTEHAKKLLNTCRSWHNDDVKRWDAHKDRATLRFPRLNYESRPSNSYNAMMNPIIPYSIRGVLWYQGEMNSGPENYIKLFPYYAKMMREIFENPKLPIYSVQLPDYKENHWPKTRDVQRKLADIVPNTGVAITIDGNEIDLHPRDKTMVVDRLSRMVLADNYGKKLVSRSPMPDTLKLKGDNVEVKFKNTYKGLKLKGDGKEVNCFEVAGSDKKFVKASAKIATKSSVKVKIPNGIADPQFVRYAWEADPDVNLYNSGDLPASPFEEPITK